jgi:hypothetical protein
MGGKAAFSGVWAEGAQVVLLNFQQDSQVGFWKSAIFQQDCQVLRNFFVWEEAIQGGCRGQKGLTG